MGIFASVKEQLGYIPEEDRIDTFSDEAIIESTIVIYTLVFESRYAVLESEKQNILKKVYDKIIEFVKYVREKIKSFFMTLSSKMKDARDRLQKKIVDVRVNDVLKNGSYQIAFPSIHHINFIDMVNEAADILITEVVNWKIYDKIKEVKNLPENERQTAISDLRDKSIRGLPNSDPEFDELHIERRIFRKLPILRELSVFWDDYLEETTEELRQMIYEEIAPGFARFNVKSTDIETAIEAEEDGNDIHIFDITKLSDIDYILKPFYDSLRGVDKLPAIYSKFISRFNAEANKIETMIKSELGYSGRDDGNEYDKAISSLAFWYIDLTRKSHGVFMTYTSILAWISMDIARSIDMIRNRFYTKVKNNIKSK